MSEQRQQGSSVLDEPDERRKSGRGLGHATRVQVTGHQFNARRAALGLTLRRVGMETEPGRRQSMAMLASVTLTAVICLGALFWSVIRPAGSVGESRIVADQNTGALYVKVGETLYPALNLASARLIAGTADNPVRVRRSEIDSRPRGAMVGIPGAPSELTATAPLRSSWLVCDAVTKAFGAGAPEPVTVTVIDGQPDLSDRRRVLDKRDAVLLRYGDDVWLIRDGRRSRVDPSQRPVLLALGVPGEAITTARPMSRALFDAIPVGAALTVPDDCSCWGAGAVRRCARTGRHGGVHPAGGRCADVFGGSAQRGAADFADRGPDPAERQRIWCADAGGGGPGAGGDARGDQSGCVGVSR